jgi:zinc transport system substrate-binding protein
LIRKTVSLVVVFTLLLSCAACAGKAADDGKVSVIYTVRAFGEIAKAIGGDSVRTASFMPDGVEMHDFEPTAQSIVSVRDADIFLYSDLTDGAWFDTVEAVCKKSGTKTVNLSEGIVPIALQGGGVDPHFWLSLKNADIIAQNIKIALSEVSPPGTTGFERNFDEFTGKSARLFGDYSEKYSGLQKRTFVCDHAAFGYLCAEFGLTQKSVTGVFDGGEPSAKELAELIDFCAANDIHNIFMEYGTDESVMRTLANEFGGSVSTVNTLESGGVENLRGTGEDNNKFADGYIDIMFANLDTIYEGLLK